jgi:hypothetical protein
MVSEPFGGVASSNLMTGLALLAIHSMMNDFHYQHFKPLYVFFGKEEV